MRLSVGLFVGLLFAVEIQINVADVIVFGISRLVLQHAAGHDKLDEHVTCGILRHMISFLSSSLKRASWMPIAKNSCRLRSAG